MIFGYKNHEFSYFDVVEQENIQTAAQISETKQWIQNPNFTSPIEPKWFWKNGTDGDNSDVNSTSSSGQANFEVMGETRTFTVVSGIINSSTSLGWKQFNKTGFLLPDTAEINASGGYVSHFWDDDPNQFPSVQWKTNISMPIDMSDYIITSASLEVIVNATVSDDVDTPNDGAYWENFAIGDSVTYYSQISDLDYNPPLYTVASNKTKYLGQNSPSSLTLTNKSLETVSEVDLITALNSAFDKDVEHSNFTLTLGIDIYSEDNLGSNDPDTFDELIIKTCNLTFTVMKKIDQSTTLSWNQIGDKITGSSVQILDANFNFKYKINKTWPTSAPLSELRFYINNKSYDVGIIKLSTANGSFQEAISGGFDVTDLITANVNISVSLQLFLKDTFELEEVYSISITEVYLNISYIKTFPDYGSKLNLFLNEQNKTADPVIQVSYFNTLNITVTYTDNETGEHLSNSNVIIEGKISNNLTEDQVNENYYIYVNVSDLGFGAKILTVTAQKVNYESKSFQIYVEVIEQPTDLKLLIDNVERSENETIDVRFNEILNVTAYFTYNTTTHVTGATVNLLGFGIFNESINHYNITLNTNNLDQGINVLTIYAQLQNYQSQTIQLFVNVQERDTTLLLFIEDNQVNPSGTFNTQFGENLNITVFYQDDNTSTYIGGANLELLGIGTLNETSNQYNISIETNILVRGVNVLTIFAYSNGYQDNTIQFFINVNERATELLLYLDGVQFNDSDTFQVEINEDINIIAFFRDDFTDLHLNNASVELLGIGILNETSNQYNITINSSGFELGSNILSVFAQLEFYQPNSIQIFVEVVKKATYLIINLNGVDKTNDPDLHLPINSLLNITIKYLHNQTGFEISGALLQLIGEGLTENLIENVNFSHYSFILDTRTLGIGTNLFTVVAQATDFQVSTINLRITVDSIRTSINTITGEAFFDINSEDDFQIQIVLNDTDFGGIIENASVTYRWGRGQGELIDLDNDGIYNAVLQDVPTGSYVVSIIAYAGENYEFETFEIIINARTKPGFDFTYIILLLSIGIVGLGTYFALYQKYFKYPPKVRKIRKLRKKISKNKKLNPVSLQTREDIIKNKIQQNVESLGEKRLSKDSKFQVKGIDLTKQEGEEKIE